MTYYRVDIKCDNEVYILCISDSYILSTDYLDLKNLVYEFLKSQNVHINGKEVIHFQEFNEKEFNELKNEVVLNSNLRIRY